MIVKYCGLRFLAVCLLTMFASTAFAQRNLKDIPEPDPDSELESFTVADGFEVKLYAADPLLASPIQMNFDAEGKLWIASSEVYPHIKPGQKATDKILVLEDTDRDGQADKTTVFADGLLIPTGVLPGDGGAYVVNSTELLHMKDTDGDGKADQRRVVLSGFGTEDTHHLLHTLRWGVDGSIYMNQSIYIHSHVETPYGVKRLNGGGIWRFRPDTLQLDVFCRGFVNAWGHHQDRWGQSFATDGAYGEGINYVFPGARYVAVPGEKRRLKGLNPGSPKHCGLEILSGSHLPPEWRGDMVTNDFRAHRVCRFKITEDGSGYASRQQEEVLKTRHVAFRPIDVKMGPDGAIYIADWYNPIIQHGEVDFRDPRRDHVHGRIWRVTAKGRPLVKRRKIVGAPIEDLLEMLKADEDWVRLWAKQELKTRDHEKVFTAVEKWIENDHKNWTPFDHVMLEISWLYQTMNSPGEAPPKHLLESAIPNVRAAAIRLTDDWSDATSPPLDVYRNAVHDEHPRVRLEAVRALAKVPTVEAAKLAAEALDHPMDRWLDFALWQAMRDLKPQWLPAVERGEFDFGGNVEHLTFALKAVDSPAIVPLMLTRIESEGLDAAQLSTTVGLIAELGTPEQLSKVLAHIANARDKRPAQQTADALIRLVDASGTRRVKPNRLSDLSQLLNSESQAVRIAAMKAAGSWKSENHRSKLLGLIVQDKLDNLPEQLAAIDAVSQLGGRASLQAIVGLVERSENQTVRIHAAAAVCRVAPSSGAGITANLLATMKPEDDPSPMLNELLKQKKGSALLGAALSKVKLDTDVAKVALRVVRGASGDTQELQDVLRKVGSITTEPKKYTADELAALVAEVKEKGDPRRGEAIYRRNDMRCMNCHAIGGAGGKVGPDMVSIGASAQVDYLLQSLVDPNAKIKENFHSLIVEDDRGRVHSGIPIQRNDQRIVLRDANDKEVTIAAENIDLVREGKSLMPEGLVDPLTRAELVDLTRFLAELGKEGDFAVGKERVVRRWRKLTWTPEGHRRLNRTSHDTAATDDPALTWAAEYSRVSGELPVQSLAPFEIHRGHPANSFVRFEVNVTTAGEVALKFKDVQGLKLWLADKPATIEPMTKVNLAQGHHRFTLAIDRTERKIPLRVELVDVENSTAQAELVTGQ